MRHVRFTFLVVVTIGLICTWHVTSFADQVSFTRDVRPILSDACFACHGPDESKREADLRLDLADSIEQSGVIVAGNPEASELYQRLITGESDEVMPPADFHKPLTPKQIDVVKRWIASGAEIQGHWSFVPPVRPAVPSVGVNHPIDAFLQRRLKEEGLKPSPLADRRTLIRRVTLDLTGLPPTVEEINAFLEDDSPDAYERLIDRLMDRVSFGEHMARYWLDLARYADTHGLHLDNERSMWPYRDWVVRAFHENLPFDEFTRWQLAGDLLPNPTRDQLIASGFNRCNVTTSEGGSIAEEWVFRYAVDRATTATEVWMGLTAGCAVCHDHKFDPLSTKDFYSLYAFFHSAADPAMDGNKIDTPPILKLYSDEDEARIKRIDEQLVELKHETNQIVKAFEYTDPALLDPLPEPVTEETIWMDDGFPAGANLEFTGQQPARFVTKADGPVFEGEKSLQRSGPGITQDFYSKGASPIRIPKDGTVFVNCFLDPDDPPETIMLQFHSDGWKHRAVWGAEAKIPWGTAGKPDKVVMGKLPKLGKWVQLEVPAQKMGLKANATITGFAFTQFDGKVTWDHLGIRHTQDRAKDPRWSWKVWKELKAGKRNNELPEGLRQLVRGSRAENWTDEEHDRVFDHWIKNTYEGVKPMLAEIKQRQGVLIAEKSQIEKDVPFTFVMADLPTPRESFVMLRGAYDNPGDRVFRNVPGFLPPLSPKESGADYDRLDLANWLVSGEHPLTSRVAVNRFWQQFFGAGIVLTSGDFGSQGDPPSHPELLDWLAVEFVEQGWDMKRLIKLIVTSHAYRQRSEVGGAMLAKDPENRLLARAPRLRLDAEVLRDQALFVSGLLVPTVGGKSVKPYQPENIWEPVGFGNSNTRYYKQDSGDALYRRSIYTFLKRTAPPPFMSTFDAPNREQSCTVRGRSNTPMQALQLMNDVQHVEAAREFATRMMVDGGERVESRIRWAMIAATAREANDDEIEIIAGMLNRFLERYQTDSESAQQLINHGESEPDGSIKATELAAYTMVANLILNLDETVNKN